jgi:uncharacterized membrane protein
MTQKTEQNKSYEKTIIDLIRTEKPQTTAQLIELTKERTDIDDAAVLEILFQLENEGRINLGAKAPKKYFTARNYILSSEARWFWATIIVAMVTMVAITIPENMYPLIYAREVLGIVFVLALPGYTLIKALFPTGNNKVAYSNIGITERAALSIGVSLAIIPIVGLILNYSPWGITLYPTILSLLSLTILFAVIALVREYPANH